MSTSTKSFLCALGALLALTTLCPAQDAGLSSSGPAKIIAASRSAVAADAASSELAPMTLVQAAPAGANPALATVAAAPTNPATPGAAPATPELCNGKRRSRRSRISLRCRRSRSS